jgi:hypothetical protein
MDASIVGIEIGAPVIIFGGTILGIFKTKTPGWGRYTTSLFILVLVLFVAALAWLVGKIESSPLVNLLFAIAGYAGGLIGVGGGRRPAAPSHGGLPGPDRGRRQGAEVAGVGTRLEEPRNRPGVAGCCTP